MWREFVSLAFGKNTALSFRDSSENDEMLGKTRNFNLKLSLSFMFTLTFNVKTLINSCLKFAGPTKSSCVSIFIA